MKRLAIPLSLAAVTLVAACAAPYYAPAQTERGAPIVPQATNYRAGVGTITATMLTPSPMGGAYGGTATGASAHPAGTSATDRPSPPVGAQSSSAGRLNRLAVRMDAGGDTQYVDTDSNEFKKGDRVELTPDHMIRKPQ